MSTAGWRRWAGWSGVVGPVSTVPLSIDSSDATVMEVGLDLVEPGWAGGRRRCSTRRAADRVDVLDLAARHGSPVVLSSTGARRCPPAPRSGWSAPSR